MRFLPLLLCLLAASLVADAEPSREDYKITTQARWAIIATWLGIGVAVFGFLLTIRRDRASMRKSIDERTAKIVAAILNEPEYRKRVDERTREVARELAYTEFHFDRRWQSRLDQIETDIEELQRRPKG